MRRSTTPATAVTSGSRAAPAAWRRGPRDRWRRLCRQPLGPGAGRAREPRSSWWTTCGRAIARAVPRRGRSWCTADIADRRAVAGGLRRVALRGGVPLRRPVAGRREHARAAALLRARTCPTACGWRRPRCRPACLRFVLSSTAALFGDPGAHADRRGRAARPVERLWREQADGGARPRLGGPGARAALAPPALLQRRRGRPERPVGEDHEPETHLIPLAIGAALGTRPPLTVFGADYPTPDGTCIRDYVHVTDLADAHLRVLARLEQGELPLQCRQRDRLLGARGDRGGGARRRHVPCRIASGPPGRGPGGSGRVFRAVAPRIPAGRRGFGALDEIVRTAWAWHASHPRGFDDRGSKA